MNPSRCWHRWIRTPAQERCAPEQDKVPDDAKRVIEPAATAGATRPKCVPASLARASSSTQAPWCRRTERRWGAPLDSAAVGAVSARRAGVIGWKRRPMSRRAVRFGCADRYTRRSDGRQCCRRTPRCSAERRLGRAALAEGCFLGTAGLVLRRQTWPRVRPRRTADSRRNLRPRRRCCPAGVGSCRSRRGRRRSAPARRRARRGRHALGEIPVHHWRRGRIRV